MAGAVETQTTSQQRTAVNQNAWQVQYTGSYYMVKDVCLFWNHPWESPANQCAV